jgi:signal transduction histidine kinase
LKIRADEQKIDQVLVNFVNNAVKYAPDSKEIVVEVQELHDKVKISVIDFGKGIPNDKIPFLFNSYYQIEKAEKSIQGLGLGLYISAEIIKKHNGEIGVDSEIGKGSTFWFTLPKPS